MFAAMTTAIASPVPPNIVLLLADDLGYAELGCQGNRDIPTPHIDALAKNGVRFTQAYVTAPYRSPSRAGLLTGRYQTRFGHELNPVGKANLDERAGLPLSEITLADALKSAGYKTGLIGKWHLGGTSKHHPLQRGFDEFFGFLHEGHFYLPIETSGSLTFLRTNKVPENSGPRWREGNIIWSTHMRGNEPHYDEDNPVMRGQETVEEREYLTDALTREAVDFIRRHKAHPFFLYLAYNAPHSPMQAPAQYLRRFSHIGEEHRRVFAAMVSAMDDSVGAIMARLRAEGLEERTLVFFLSDNGGPTAELTSSNLPLRGGKGQLYEGGIRVPFIVQWKGRLPAGKVYEPPVSAVDIFPTALAAARRPLSGDRVYDGVNLVPYLTDERKEAPHPTLFWRMGAQSALLHGQDKLLKLPARFGSSPQRYHLAEDISEQNNRVETDSEKAKQLTNLYEDLDRQMVEPNWGGAAQSKGGRK